MVREFSNPPFLEWIGDAVLRYLAIVGLLGLLGLFVSAIILVARYGPHPAGDMIYRLIVSAAVDLARFSPRRVFALARLAVQESIRRRVWVALVVFAVILLFAGWFLNPTSSDPTQIASFQTAKLYINFVLTATTYLVLLLALFLSAFSLPADIKSRTIFTVVTKPVRTGEIVLGRMLGFTAIGTALIVIMGLASYVFVTRTLNHTHEITAADLVDLPSEPGVPPGQKEGKTSIEHGHSHRVTLNANGDGITDVVQGHYHHVHAEKDGDKVRYVVGPPEDELIARVPIYVDADAPKAFRFLDRSGKETTVGVNIGKEWTYRSFLDGGTPMAAIWKFKGITKEQFPDGRLPLEMYLRVFRTYKGEIADEKHRNRAVGIPGSIMLRNPSAPYKSIAMPFEALDQMIDKRMVLGPLLEREVDGQYETIGLFKNTPGAAHPEQSLVDDDGKIEVVLQCLAPSQYIGVARDDVYLRAAEGSFGWNFCKGYFGIWIQMVLIIAFGVAFSTFLSGPVAMLGALASLVLGFFTADISNLFLAVIRHDYKLVPGGGPIESLIRILGQKTITLELEPSLGVQVAQFLDKVLMTFMKAVVDVLPNFNDFSNVQFVAEGFDIPWNRLLEQATTGLGFFVALFLVGHIFLRMRELGK
jgi:ABC-type transport system involved in multi-copper enzyme maturation permease subunit